MEKNNDVKLGKSDKDYKNLFKNIVYYINKNSIIAYIIISIPVFVLVMMLTAQMKTVSTSTAITEGKRETELIDDLVTLQRMYDELEEKHLQSEKIVEEYKSNSSSNTELITSMEQELQKLEIYAGTTDLVGEGIKITLNDGDKALEPELRSDAVVHDSDILTVVNELKAAGAEAISINGQRIISMSAIRCVGPVVQINYQKVAPPYTINAIGNAQYLESAINIKNGVADLLTEIGVIVDVKRDNNVSISKYQGSLDFKNAKSVSKEK